MKDESLVYVIAGQQLVKIAVERVGSKSLNLSLCYTPEIPEIAEQYALQCRQNKTDVALTSSHWNLVRYTKVALKMSLKLYCGLLNNKNER